MPQKIQPNLKADLLYMFLNRRKKMLQTENQKGRDNLKK